MLPKSRTTMYRKRKNQISDESSSENDDDNWREYYRSVTSSDTDEMRNIYVPIPSSPSTSFNSDVNNRLPESPPSSVNLRHNEYENLPISSNMSSSEEETISDSEESVLEFSDDLDDEDFRNCNEVDGENQDNPEDLSFRRLKHVIENDEVINLNISVSPAELLLAILKFGNKYELCQSARADLFKMFNAALQKKILPESRYLIDQLFNSKDIIEYHAVCPNPICKRYVKQFDHTDKETVCNVCGTTISLKSPVYKDFFTIINIDNDIAHLVRQNIDHINEVRNQRLIDNDVIEDFCHGSKYKDFVRSLPPEERKNFVTVTFNCDGAPIFKSSKFSIWPIQLIINELPYHVRTDETISCGFWFGNKPDMNIYLMPWVQKMNRLSNEGIRVEINGEIQILKVHTLCCCVDSGARGPMQGIVQYNGYFGCSWCLHPGVYVPTARGGCVKYVRLEEAPPKRTHELMIRHMQESLTSGNPVFGVKRPSWLINLNHLDIVSGLVPDDLHFMSHGVGKQVTDNWCDSTNMPFSLTNQNIIIIDRLLEEIKVPIQVTRLSRGISDRSWWPGREYENWILYFSVPLLSQFPHMREYLEHWALLVEAFYISKQNSITRPQLERAHDLYQRFENAVEDLYGQHDMTYNIHQLNHVAQSIADWGPLNTHNSYAFESGNGKLLRKIHAAKGVIHQLCRSVCLSQSEILLRLHLDSKPKSLLKSFVAHLDKREADFTVKIDRIRYFGPNFPTKPLWINRLGLSTDSRTYSKIVKNRCLYTSYKRKRMRSSNSFAITTDGFYIYIRNFIVDETNSHEYVLCKRINVANADGSFPVKRILSLSRNVIAIETKNILKICVYVKNDSAEYVCAVPNTDHY